jgi:hypothetical protein
MLARGLALVQESVANLELKLKESEERATKWERLYMEVKGGRHVKEEVVEVEPDNGKKSKEEPAPVETDKITDAAFVEVGSDELNSLDDTTKKWIQALGLQNSYGTRDTGLRQIGIKEYVKPSSFDEVFLLTDFLFPVDQGDDSYYKKLFVDDKRPGLKVRSALRDIKKKTPNEPLVSWHEYGPWTPPTASSLTLMIRFILDM